MATTVTSDAEFKTYVEGLTAFTTDTVYMNDDSKYWTFTRENNGKINAMCVTSNNVELWMYDGTDWVINRVPSIVDNLTSTSTIDALSAKQGKVLNEKISVVQTVDVSGTLTNIASGTGSSINLDFAFPVGCSKVISITPYSLDGLNLVPLWIQQYSNSNHFVTIKAWNGRTSAISELHVNALIACI